MKKLSIILLAVFCFTVLAYSAEAVETAAPVPGAAINRPNAANDAKRAEWKAAREKRQADRKAEREKRQAERKEAREKRQADRKA
ncbi:MAG TPA: hypothetical protein VMT55_04120, partial [Candidatus Sulfotelmatobacter sp.]|nr:hypothetical protein [Candidatus Sulfotelmatobacter sp.]